MLNFETGLISEKTLEEDLINFASFDYDASGNNGDDFLIEEARELGITTNQYWAREAMEIYKKTGEVVKAIEYFLDDLKLSWECYSEVVDYNINQELVKDKILITFTYSDE